jgi:hypothetical protein
MLRVAGGVIVGLVIASVVGVVALGREVTANTVGIEQNCTSIKETREDMVHRLDRIEDTQNKILQKLK